MEPPATRGAGGYDYRTASERLAQLVRSLQELGAAAPGSGGAAAAGGAAGAAPPTRLAAALRFARTNRASLLALVTLYSIPTAAVVAMAFADRQKAVRLRAPRPAPRARRWRAVPRRAAPACCCCRLGAARLQLQPLVSSAAPRPSPLPRRPNPPLGRARRRSRCS
jgi:hypothetical protein